MLGFTVVCAKVAAAGSRSAAAKVKILVRHTVHFKATHHAIPLFCSVGGWRSLFYDLPITGLVVNNRKHCRALFTTIVTGKCFLTLRLTSWFYSCDALDGIMIDRFTVCFTAYGTGLWCEASSILPIVAERKRIPVPLLAAYRTSLGLCAGCRYPCVFSAKALCHAANATRFR